MRAIAVSMASRIAASIVTFRGAIAIVSIVTPSKRAICSRTNASPRARTPAIAPAATRMASSFDSARRASSACRAFSTDGIDGLLDPRDQLAHALRFGAVDRLRHDQARRDLGDRL